LRCENFLVNGDQPTAREGRQAGDQRSKIAKLLDMLPAF
jgi:hypothetical protein